MLIISAENFEKKILSRKFWVSLNKTSRGGLEVEYTASKVGALRRWFESRLGRNLRD